uniref:Secreted protein n=1 Tax=Gongylonema pulchrum TaxID=637853 RepID=A0A183DK29_9BILA
LGAVLPTSSSVPVALGGEPAVATVPSTSCAPAAAVGVECASSHLLSCSPCSSESAPASLTPFISGINSPAVSAPTIIGRPESAASAQQTPYVHVFHYVLRETSD